MIQLYKSSNTNYTNNGDYVLKDCIRCEPKQELNGMFELELEHIYDDEGRWEYLIIDNVIAAPTPTSSKQLFRIYKVEKDMLSVVIYGRHIFFDLLNEVLISSTLTRKTGQEALDLMLANTNFTGHSNITTLNSTEYKRKNIVGALASDDDNSFVKLWGGERYYDNFNVYCNTEIGSDNGVSVLFGKNLEEIKETIDFSSVATRLIPVGYDGIMLNSPYYVDSPNIRNYANIITKVVEFSDVKVSDDGFATLIEAQAELTRRCNDLFTKGLDAPEVNYKVSMELLQNTTEYKNFEVLETVNLGDYVTCKHSKININVKARCISYTWNCLTNKYIEIELGNFVPNYLDNIADISNRVSSLNNKVTNVVDGDGKLRAEEVKGFLDGTKAKLKASRNVAETQQQRVIEFEDLDVNSDTYGSTILGTQGIFVSDTRNPENTDWNYTSALTAKGLVAAMLYGKILVGSSAYLNLETAEFFLGGGTEDKVEHTNSYSKYIHTDGSYSKISADGMERFINGTGKKYHCLSYASSLVVESGQTVFVPYPDEFQDKNVTWIVSTGDILTGATSTFALHTFNVGGSETTVNNKKGINFMADIWFQVANGTGYTWTKTGKATLTYILIA